jgi:hypothetical protein
VRTDVLLAALLLTACSPPPRAQPGHALPGDAAEALAALEARLDAAPNVRFTSTTSAPRPAYDLTAEVALGRANRLRITSEGAVSGVPLAPGAVSDGAHMRGGRSGAEGAEAGFDVPAHDGLRAGFVGLVLRHGLDYVLLHLSAGQPLDWTDVDQDFEADTPGDPNARMPVDDVAWGPETTWQGHRVRALQFTLPYDWADEAAATLWLDAETGLPLRRTERTVDEGEVCESEETYAGWSFDPVPDEWFAVPAERH